MEAIIDENTSVIRINSSSISPIVYLSTTRVVDHFATVIDTGYVTPDTPIHLSTVDTLITGGQTDLYIRQPFGYISLVAVSEDEWSVVNRDPFSVNAPVIRALDAKSVTMNTLSTTLLYSQTLESDYITLNSVTAEQGHIGTQGLRFDSLNVSSNLQVSTLSVSTSQSASASLLDMSGTSATIQENLTIGGPIGLQDIRVRTITATNFYLDSITTSRNTSRTIEFLTMAAPSIAVSTLIASNMYLGSTSITETEPSIGSSIKTSSIEGDFLQAYEMSTPTISAKTIEGELYIIQLSSSAIVNPLGSLSLSTLTMNSITGRDLYGTDISASTVSLSSITMTSEDPISVVLQTATDDFIFLDSFWSISTNALTTGFMSTSTLSANNISTQMLTGDNVFVDTVEPSKFTIQSELSLLGNLFYTPKASLTTSELSTSVAHIASTRTINLSGLQSLESELLNLSSIQVAHTSAESTSAFKASTSNIFTRNITLGNRIQVNPMDPRIEIDSLTPLDLPPYQTLTGIGTYTNPVKTFNTLETTVYFSIYNPSGKPLYLNLKTRHTNLPPPNANLNGGAFGYINGVRMYAVDNQLQQELIEITQLDINIGNYPSDSLNPSTGDNTPYFAWVVNIPSVTTDELTLWVSNNLNAVDVASRATIDTNAGLSLRQGIIEWPSTIYGVSIINPFNDIQTRSLFYTGSLQSVSDRALKRDLGEADLEACVAAARVPLHTYEYIPAFASTFQVEDKRRLGLLTTEVQTVLPKSISLETILGVSTEVLSTDQIRYAHLGATKYLIAEVQRLRQKLLDT
jgi:hypothetical protein